CHQPRVFATEPGRNRSTGTRTLDRARLPRGLPERRLVSSRRTPEIRGWDCRIAGSVIPKRAGLPALPTHHEFELSKSTLRASCVCDSAAWRDTVCQETCGLSVSR